MAQIHLVPNTNKITFRHPQDGEELSILPGEALYDPQTGYIHVLKSNNFGNPIFLQLCPIKIANKERNRAIARLGSAIVSAFGIEFFEDDSANEIADFFFDEAVDFSLNSLADFVSNLTAKQVGLGYYEMKEKRLIFNFPIIVSGY